MLGQTISHYRITDKLGEGGMGVVYKAEDTKLERTVALKFLAAHLVSDEEIRKRFEREAKAAAALNHPNICHVYEIDEAEGKTFIAMAFIEGQGLDAKIATGPLKLDEALDIAHQIAQGLQAAHEKGIVHRDIKPANVMITGSGSRRQLTIMDFGLAQLTEHSKLTRMDETMGTVAYMSPEQTMGADVDRRSDIWALGVVLYEMITGQRPFKGHYDKAVMYSITNEEPEPITALRTGVPMELEWIVAKCLAKEADSRYQNAGDMAVDLKNLQEKLKSGRSAILRTSTSVTSVGARHAAPGGAETEIGARPEHAVPLQPTWKRYLPWAVAAGAVLIAVAVSFVHFREAQPELPLRRFSFTTSSDIVTLPIDHARANLAISPDGRHIALATVGRGTIRQLWVRSLDQSQPRLITEADGLAAPFWSPGSDYIAFAARSGDALEVRRVSVEGGPSSRVCELPGDFYGGAWSPDGEVIVFSASSTVPAPSSQVSVVAETPRPTLYQVPAGGGGAKLLFAQETPSDSGEPPEQLMWPHFLPAEAGSRVLVYADLLSAAEQTLIAHDLTTGRREMIGPGAFPVHSSSGHLVLQASLNNYDLLAAPFFLEVPAVHGRALPDPGKCRPPQPGPRRHSCLFGIVRSPYETDGLAGPPRGEDWDDRPTTVGYRNAGVVPGWPAGAGTLDRNGQLRHLGS